MDITELFWQLARVVKVKADAVGTLRNTKALVAMDNFIIVTEIIFMSILQLSIRQVFQLLLS